MSTFQIRSRGQSALFAGMLLLIFIPLLSVIGLTPSGYGDALRSSFEMSNDAALLQWANAHLNLVIIYALIETIPLISILALPTTLRRVVFGDGGRVSQWLGVAALVLIAVMTLLNLALLVGAAQQYAGASTASRSSIGANFWITAGTEAIIADVLGGLLFTAWLWTINFALIRLGGLERWVGVAGLFGAALFASSAALVAFDPRQSHTAIVGAAFGWFGLWLGLVGYLLIIRAPALGATVATEPATVTEPNEEHAPIS